MKSFPVLLLLSTPLSTFGQESCKNNPFEIKTSIVPTADNEDFGCDESESTYIAKMIAATVDTTIVKALQSAGTTDSVSKVCKKATREEIPPTDGLRGRRLFYGNYIYRGGGRCRWCRTDNYDYRRMLREKKTTSSSPVRDLSRSVLESITNSTAATSAADEGSSQDHNNSQSLALPYANDMNGNKQTERHLSHHNYVQDQVTSDDLYVVSKEIQEAVIEEAQKVLKYILGDLSENEGLCTFGKIDKVKIEMSTTLVLMELECGDV